MDACQSVGRVSASYASNIKKVFAVLFLSVATREISFGTLFDAYLLDLGGSSGNVLVGSVESIRGMIQLLLAWPLGLLADRMPRVRLCRYNLFFLTAGFALLISGVLLDNISLIYLGMAVWAPSFQCWFTSSSAIVADSCPPETRTTTIANMSNVQLIGSSLGPLIQLCCLFYLGTDHWETSTLHHVIGIGCIIFPFVVGGTLTLAELEPLEKTSAKGRSRFETVDLERPLLKVPARWFLAIGLQIATTITAMGAGMTVKFFPLFFKTEYGFEPRDLCMMTFAYPLAMALMQRVCLRVAAHLGRLQAIMLFHILGTACLFWLSVAKSVYLALPLYFIRGALMNARQPILAAVTMDLVTTEMRGRWSSIQSIASFSWSGSAFVGGWVAQSAGYRASFAVTAAVYTFSALVYIPFMLVFPDEREKKILQQKYSHVPSHQTFMTPVTPCGVLNDSQLQTFGDIDLVGLDDDDNQVTKRDSSARPL